MDDRPFLGSEALRDGRIANKHRLRTRYVALFPDVYLPIGVRPDLWRRTQAAWLWSHRRGVISGRAAAALHGAKWVGDDVPIELIWSNLRAPEGIVTHRDSLACGEVTMIAGMAVTTRARTAFDLGRRLQPGDAVAGLDALGNAALLDVGDVMAVARGHPGARNLRSLMQALDLHDPGAQSPRETWLRLLLTDAGFPRPRTQIPVVSADGRRRYYLDMGWEDVMIAVEYDGDHHRVDPAQYAYDIERSEDLADLGWLLIRVVKRSHPVDIIRRVRHAWPSRVR